MAVNVGTATLDFGAHPGLNEAQVAVTGQATITGTAKIDAFVMGDDTSANHTAADHRWFENLCNLTCGSAAAGVGFTIYARSVHQLTGQWTVRWIWAD